MAAGQEGAEGVPQLNHPLAFHYELRWRLVPRRLGPVELLRAWWWDRLARVWRANGLPDWAEWARLRALWIRHDAILLPPPPLTDEERAFQRAMRDAARTMEDQIIRGRK